MPALLTVPPFSKMTAAPPSSAAADTVSFEPFPTVTVSAWDADEDAVTDCPFRTRVGTAAVLREAAETADAPGALVRVPSTVMEEPWVRIC